jgi:capsular exopolysaccharide synthesis family protein
MDNIPLATIIDFVKRGLLPALITALIVGALAYFVSRALPRQYDATTAVLAAQNNADLRSFGVLSAPVPTLDISAYRKAVLSSPVLAEALHINPQDTKAIDSFSRMINLHIEPAQDSSLMDIVVTDGSAEQAAIKANALAAALIDWEKRRAVEGLTNAMGSLEQQIGALDAQIRTLQVEGAAEDQISGRINLRAEQQGQLEYAKALRSSATGYLSIIEPALPPLEPVAPRPFLNAILAAILTGLLSYGILHLRETLDTRLSDAEAITKVSGLPVLASFPKMTHAQRQLPTEGVSYLRNNLHYNAPDAYPQIILVTSPKEKEGKTSVAMSLAENFSRNNYHTLLVDADLRQPSIAKEYKMVSARLEHTSLETWLRNPLTTREVVRVPLDETHSLFVIPSFQFNSKATELLSVGFHDCLESWRKEYDVIVIDSAAVLSVADALTLAPLCTSTLMVVSSQTSNRHDLRTAIDLCKRVGARMAGIVSTQAKHENASAPVTATQIRPPSVKKTAETKIIKDGKA